jgi:hypothetical protein
LKKVLRKVSLASMKQLLKRPIRSRISPSTSTQIAVWSWQISNNNSQQRPLQHNRQGGGPFLSPGGSLPLSPTLLENKSASHTNRRDEPEPSRATGGSPSSHRHPAKNFAPEKTVLARITIVVTYREFDHGDQKFHREIRRVFRFDYLTLPHCHPEGSYGGPYGELLASLFSQGSGVQFGVTQATGGYAASFCTGTGKLPCCAGAGLTAINTMKMAIQIAIIRIRLSRVFIIYSPCSGRP